MVVHPLGELHWQAQLAGRPSSSADHLRLQWAGQTWWADQTWWAGQTSWLVGQSSWLVGQDEGPRWWGVLLTDPWVQRGDRQNHRLWAALRQAARDRTDRPVLRPACLTAQSVRELELGQVWVRVRRDLGLPLLVDRQVPVEDPGLWGAHYSAVWACHQQGQEQLLQDPVVRS